MNVTSAMQSILIREWAQQIRESQESGLSIRKWCDENGIGIKTYYYRRKRVREELLNNMESESATQLVSFTSKQLGAPVFAALPMPQRHAAAVTVQIGMHIAEIHNGADADTVESVLRTLTRL